MKEGFNEIYNVLFPPLSNVVQSGNDKKTKLTYEVKSKINDKLERKRQERNVKQERCKET